MRIGQESEIGSRTRVGAFIYTHHAAGAKQYVKGYLRVKISQEVSHTAAQMRPGDVRMEHAHCSSQNSVEVTRLFWRHAGIKIAPPNCLSTPC